jgi:branched-chain amino acid transport system substrate-binding protein
MLGGRAGSLPSRLFVPTRLHSEEEEAVSRNYARSLGVIIAVGALALGAAACQKEDTGGGTTAKCEGKIAFVGALTGGDAGAVLPSRDAAKLAFKKFKAENPNCNVEMVEHDTQGAPDQATPIANKIITDASVVGVIGLAFSGESKATMPIFEGAGLVMVSQSATNPELTKTGNKSFHRVNGNDDTQGEAAVKYFKDQKLSKVFVINDGSTYGAGIAKVVSTGLGASKAGEDTVQKAQTNFDATISKIRNVAGGVDAIAFGGYTTEGAPLLKQIRAGGINVPFIGFDGVYDPQFAAGAGSAAEGAIVTCPCIPAAQAPGTFAADFKAEYGADPGAYTAEGWDAAQIYLQAFKAGKSTRAEMLAWVDAYDAAGLSKHIKFDPTGEVDKKNVVVWAYEIKGGKLTPKVEIKLG